MKFQILFLFVSILFSATAAQAQCTFDPTVTGDTILCPGSPGVLTTQEFDSYQWYRREFSGTTAVAITGATQQTLAVTGDDVLYHFSVAATKDGCTETSPEVLLDGWVFLLPTVIQTGDYEFDPNTGTFKICAGDTLFLTLGQPYDTNITWYNNGSPIPNETGVELAITEAGAYTVEGAPSVCPDYIQPLGLVLEVTTENCTSPTLPTPLQPDLAIFPNPAGDWLTVENPSSQVLEQIELSSPTGQIIQEFQTEKNAVQQLSLENLTSGVYFLKIKLGNEIIIRKIIKE